jgi:tetraacyldisaccharide 4'-kinase
MYRVSSALAPVVYLPGLVYEAIIRARNGLYATGKLPQYRLPRPVISIGNITLGGSGKTPLVICVAQMLEKLGHTPAVLTRGYGRTRAKETRIVAPGETVLNAAEALGDEPALIQRHVSSAWLGVSKNRLKTGKEIAKRDPKVVFILDDGFQHRKLFRDLDIVIVDASQPVQSNRIFPRGTLREPVSGLHRCDMIVFHGSPKGVQPDTAGLMPQDLKPRVTIVHCKQTIQALVPFTSWNHNPAASKAHGCTSKVPKSAYLVSAIGNPERFQRDIRRMGIGGPGATFFPDHHALRQKDWQKCVVKARRKGADTIITTEKDAIKISEPPDFPLFIAVQRTEIPDTDAFEIILKNRLEESL